MKNYSLCNPLDQVSRNRGKAPHDASKDPHGTLSLMSKARSPVPDLTAMGDTVPCSTQTALILQSCAHRGIGAPQGIDNGDQGR